MKMLVAVVGTVIRSSVKEKGRSVSFNLVPAGEDDIYHVITVGLGQRDMMNDLLATYENVGVVIIGHGFTYRSNKCGQHHFSLKPIFIVPLNDDHNLDALHDVVAQWFIASLLATRQQRASVLPFRPKEVHTSLKK